MGFKPRAFWRRETVLTTANATGLYTLRKRPLNRLPKVLSGPRGEGGHSLKGGSTQASVRTGATATGPLPPENFTT